MENEIEVTMRKAQVAAEQIELKKFKHLVEERWRLQKQARQDINRCEGKPC